MLFVVGVVAFADLDLFQYSTVFIEGFAVVPQGLGERHYFGDCLLLLGSSINSVEPVT